MAKIILVTSLMVGYAYLMEFFIAWYGGNPWEQFQFLNRVFGPMGGPAGSCWPATRSIPQLFWFKFARRNVWILFVVCILVNVGMWFERFVIIVTGLHRDFLPSSWGSYYPELCGSVDPDRQLRAVLDAVPALLPLSADGGDGRGEGDSAQARRERGRGRRQTKIWAICRPTSTLTAIFQGRQGDYESSALIPHARGSRASGVFWPSIATPGAAGGGRSGARRGLHKVGLLARPFRCMAWTGRWASGTTILPWLVFGGGLVGGPIALVMQWYVNCPHAPAPRPAGWPGYPLIFSGKPYWSLPANMPIMFELTVLFAALTAFFGLWALVRPAAVPLSGFRQPALPPRHRRRFFLLIEAADKKFDPKQEVFRPPIAWRWRKFMTIDPAEIEEVRD